jgi:hypothetical protein
MSDVFTTVAPVFGLIVLGFLAARTRLLSEAARAGLTEFVFTIAVPMLIFRTIVTAAAPGLGLILICIEPDSRVGIPFLPRI